MFMGSLKNSIPKKNNLPVRKYDKFFEGFEINNYLSINVIYDEVKSKKREEKSDQWYIT